MAEGDRASYTLGEIVERFGGELIGEPATRVSQVATLESAASHGQAVRTACKSADKSHAKPCLSQ